MSSAHAPLLASWMPSPLHADDAPRAPVTTQTGTAPVCSSAGESCSVPKLSPSPVAPPAHGVQLLNGANEWAWGKAQPWPPAPSIVPARNPIPASQQSPEERGGGCSRGPRGGPFLPAPSPIARWGRRDELPAPLPSPRQPAWGGFCFHSDKCASIQHLGQKGVLVHPPPPPHSPLLLFPLLDPISPSPRPKDIRVLFGPNSISLVTYPPKHRRLWCALGWGEGG